MAEKWKIVADSYRKNCGREETHMEKIIAITKDYLYIPIQTGAEASYLSLFEEESGEKILEFKVPVGNVENGIYPYAFLARVPVDMWKKKKLVLKGEFPQEFFNSVKVDDYIETARENRPEIHFTADTGWINDPNGLVFDGVNYHLYFQYNPFDVVWENMSWGHATSRDLINWTQQETVMYPDENGYMFSGSGFVNKNGCLGLPEDALMFYYTAAGECRPWTAERLFTQRLAYSIDGGKTLIKTDRGVVPVISHENRDPKVFWHEETKSYIMILWVDGNEFAILRSTDLEKWNISQRFELTDGFECPDLICLTDETGKHWFVTTADGYYYPGEFDGYSFNWSGKRYCLYMNKVPYAAQTYSNTDGRVIFVPWLRLDFKGRKYTGAMGIPRELGLIKIDNEYRITLNPVQEFKDEFKSHSFKVRDLTVFVDNGIVEVTADCDTMLGVYEV